MYEDMHLVGGVPLNSTGAFFMPGTLPAGLHTKTNKTPTVSVSRGDGHIHAQTAVIPQDKYVLTSYIDLALTKCLALFKAMYI